MLVQPSWTRDWTDQGHVIKALHLGEVLVNGKQLSDWSLELKAAFSAVTSPKIGVVFHQSGAVWHALVSTGGMDGVSVGLAYECDHSTVMNLTFSKFYNFAVDGLDQLGTQAHLCLALALSGRNMDVRIGGISDDTCSLNQWQIIAPDVSSSYSFSYLEPADYDLQFHPLSFHSNPYSLKQERNSELEGMSVHLKMSKREV